MEVINTISSKRINKTLDVSVIHLQFALIGLKLILWKIF